MKGLEDKSKEETSNNENKVKKEEIKINNKKAIKKKKQNFWAWPIKIFVLTLVLSFLFSLASELLLSSVGIALSVLIIVFLLLISIVTDMIGVAAASCDLEPFVAMSSRKIKGAKQALFLVKHAEKVSSICNDVIGDICGIISGAAGSIIILKILENSSSSSLNILVAATMSAVIAGLTVFGKAMGKKYAIDNSTKIILRVGKTFSIFTRKSK